MSLETATGEDAQLARGWVTARGWLAAVFTLLAISKSAIPMRMRLHEPVRLGVLRQLRRAEALVRRLVLAMAVETPLPATPADPNAPDPKAPRVTSIPFAQLGLAVAWRPPPPRSAPAPPRENWARPLTLQLVEPMPALIASNGQNRSVKGARPPEPTGDNPGLMRRVRALADVLADPAPMARRMRRWLARRPLAPPQERRASPLTPGWAPCPAGSDDWRVLAGAYALARDRLWRRDRLDTS